MGIEWLTVRIPVRKCCSSVAFGCAPGPRQVALHGNPHIGKHASCPDDTRFPHATLRIRLEVDLLTKYRRAASVYVGSTRVEKWDSQVGCACVLPLGPDPYHSINFVSYISALLLCRD